MSMNFIQASATQQVSFGPFRLLPYQRLLMERDEPVHLGSRALDILTVLVERPGELVTRAELMRRAWPDTVVVPANLTVHVAALRRALRDGQEGRRYLLTVPGRGYRFVAPVAFTDEPSAAVQRVPQPPPAHGLSPLFGRPIGRGEVIDEIWEQRATFPMITEIRRAVLTLALRTRHRRDEAIRLSRSRVRSLSWRATGPCRSSVPETSNDQTHEGSHRP